jgi:hypothetical protein
MEASKILILIDNNAQKIELAAILAKYFPYCGFTRNNFPQGIHLDIYVGFTDCGGNKGMERPFVLTYFSAFKRAYYEIMNTDASGNYINS